MSTKRVVVGVTGGIAAYKTCDIVSALVKDGCDVHVIMTKNATEFISPRVFEALSNNSVITEMFESHKRERIEHVSLAKIADLVVIVPCTANVIGKLSAGICDDFLTTFVMACKSPIVIAPAMNTNMYENIAQRENSALLKRRGYLFIEPSCGRLACGDEGKGRLQDVSVILDYIRKLLVKKNDLLGKNILITAGGTATAIDPVRCISNHSSGKMGIELARAAVERGACVTLVLGKSTASVDFKCRVINVETTEEMFKAVMDNLEGSHCIIKSAAPCDYVVRNASASKNKGNELTLKLEKGIDIAMEVGKRKGDSRLIIFAAETEHVVENAIKKLVKKNADIVVANDVSLPDSGFNSNFNTATLIFKDGRQHELGRMTKRELANLILDNAL